MNKYEEALNFFRSIACQCEETCDNCDINLNCDFQNRIDKQYKVLKELVEIATPKRPVIKYEYVIDGKYHCCPVCGHLILEDKLVHCACNEFLKEKNAYCSNCGQAIDWSNN